MRSPTAEGLRSASSSRARASGFPATATRSYMEQSSCSKRPQSAGRAAADGSVVGAGGAAGLPSPPASAEPLSGASLSGALFSGALFSGALFSGASPEVLPPAGPEPLPVSAAPGSPASPPAPEPAPKGEAPAPVEKK
ncbi:pentapeptide repeat-containing protein [Streptomyces pathocidini]